MQTTYQRPDDVPGGAVETTSFDISLMLSLGMFFTLEQAIPMVAYTYDVTEVDNDTSSVSASQHLVAFRADVPLKRTLLDEKGETRHGFYAPVSLGIGKGTTSTTFNDAAPVKTSSSAMHAFGGIGYGITNPETRSHLSGSVVGTYRRNKDDRAGTVTAVGAGVDLMLDLGVLLSRR